MRFLVFALLVMLVSSCSATTNKRALMAEKYNQEQQRQLGENEKGKFEYSGSSSVNNHHHIPRQDFNNYINGGNPNKGGNDDSGGN
ncbi:Homeobox protein like [Actinidia chinensis var. chinensis]|uniref:Homeobox protein like n=1 Tax=Actinidia chinensis var. chinensis TaxID=1590841 RepID=A0A2R6P7E9_ACTCC|nr:Homeobox protein like [Actinidia chinensis var. chinensis]